MRKRKEDGRRWESKGDHRKSKKVMKTTKGCVREIYGGSESYPGVELFEMLS